jgi:hypothetical protein
MANPAVRDEIKKIMAFWLRLGVIGFRIDAMPFIIELTDPGNPDSPKDYDFLTDLRQLVQWRNGDSVLLAEANVEPDRLRDYFERMIHTLRECPEVGCGTCTHVDLALPPGVLAHRADGTTGSMLFLHNLSDQPCTVDLSEQAGDLSPDALFSDQPYPDPGDLAKLALAGYGYRSIRLRH